MSWSLAVGSRPDRPTTVDEVAKAVTDYGQRGATFFSARGLWEGQLEDSVVISVAGPAQDAVVDLARFLAMRFGQVAVYVQQAGPAFLVGAEDKSAPMPVMPRKPLQPALAKSRTARAYRVAHGHTQRSARAGGA